MATERAAVFREVADAPTLKPRQPGQPRSVTTTTGGTSRTISYDYDLLGNKAAMQSPSLGTQAVGYGYDALNRLVTVTHPDGAVTRFGYDKAGNRTRLTRANGVVTTYAYDVLNRLTDLVNTNGAGQVVSAYHYVLNPDGKRLSVTESGASTSNSTASYAYDAGSILPYDMLASRIWAVKPLFTRRKGNI